MKLFTGTGRKIILFFSFLLLSTFLYSQTVPQELEVARDEIQRAVDLGAENNAADDLKEAQRLLDEADQKLANGDTDNAVTSANSARDAAVRAGMTSAPIFVNELKESADRAIKDMETKGASSEEIASAKKFYTEGEALLKKAADESAASGTSASLEFYMQAKEKFAESFNTADSALASNGGSEASSGSSTDDALSLKLNEVEVKLEKAKDYGASEMDPEDLKAAEAALAEANAALDAGSADEASSKLNVAEEKADALLEKSMSQFAAKKKDEAEKQLTSVRTAYERGSVKNATLQDYLNAANEALQSAKDKYAVQQYEESIKDSEEALNLSKVLKEQIGGGTEVAENSDTKTTPYGGGPGAGSPKKNTSEKKTDSSSHEWKEYTVKSKVPSDCLWRIAAYDIHYGHGRYWKKIYEANKSRIKNPNIIRPGMVLRIPVIPGTTGFPAEKKPVSEPEKETPAVKDDSEAVKTESPATSEDDKGSVDDHSPKEDDSAVPADDKTAAPADGGGSVPGEESTAPADDGAAAPADDQSASPDVDKNALPADDSSPIIEEDGSKDADGSKP